LINGSDVDRREVSIYVGCNVGEKEERRVLKIVVEKWK